MRRSDRKNLPRPEFPHIHRQKPGIWSYSALGYWGGSIRRRLECPGFGYVIFDYNNLFPSLIFKTKEEAFAEGERRVAEWTKADEARRALERDPLSI